MTNIDHVFIKELYQEIVEGNLSIYKKMYEKVELPDVTNPKGVERVKFIKSLNSDDRKTLYSLIKQVQVDTISSLLGIIDGSSYLEGFNDGDFKLKYGNEIKRNISGELQDLFLEMTDN